MKETTKTETTKKNKTTPAQIIKDMTLEEKASLVCGATFFGMQGIPRLDLPALMLLDGGTGLNFEQLFGDFYSKEAVLAESTNGMIGSTALTNVIEHYYEPQHLSPEEIKIYEWIKEKLYALTGCEYAPGCFPSGMLLGATFDPKVIYDMGVSLGKEARLYGIDILLGTPNVNIHRDPLNGRLFEGYSEDPYLVSALAPSLVKGVQSTGTLANVKHFAANNQETNRVGINETISERALQEIYLPGFKACVEEGNAYTVMSAYNAINGIPCSENYRLLTEILRDEWDLKGAVVSDWGAVYHPVEALVAGNDLAMPGPISPTPIIEAVKAGVLAIEDLDKAVRRLLHLIILCKDKPKMDSLSSKQKEMGLPDLLKESTDAAYEAAVAGIVMLKNNDNLFPLRKEEPRPILLIGSASKKLMECGSGSAGITTNRTSSLLDTLKTALPNHPITLLSDGSDTFAFEAYLKSNPNALVLYLAKIGGMEGNDRPNLNLSLEDDALLKLLCQWKSSMSFELALTLNVCGPITLSNYEEALDAIFVCFLPGMEGAHALGDIMTGLRYPSGKLPLSFPKRYEDTPTYLNFPGDGYEVHYGEGIYVGYRYYDKKKIRPAYPFGFGLSYTTFALSNLTLDKETFTEEIKGKVTIQNTGSAPGAEVVQIYIADEASTLGKPVKELKYFEKIHLNPGEKQILTFTLKEKDFASYDPNYQMWLAEEGYYNILIATSSAPEDIHLSSRVYLKNNNPYSYGLHSTVKTMYEKSELKNPVKHLWEKEQWDWQIVKTNHQYTPNKSLKEIFPSEPQEKHIAEFLTEIATVLHE